MTDTTTATDRWERQDQADADMYMDVTIQGLTADRVEIKPVNGHRGTAVVTLGGRRIQAQIIDTVETLRAVVDELDRQLSALEAERSGS